MLWINRNMNPKKCTYLGIQLSSYPFLEYVLAILQHFEKWRKKIYSSFEVGENLKADSVSMGFQAETSSILNEKTCLKLHRDIYKYVGSTISQPKKKSLCLILGPRLFFSFCIIAFRISLFSQILSSFFSSELRKDYSGIKVDFCFSFFQVRIFSKQ